MRIGALYRRQTKTCLPIFKCLQAKRATRQRRPRLQYVALQLRLPAHCWKRSLQVCCPQLALRKKPFSDGNQASDFRQMVLCFCRWRVGNSAFLCVNWCLQRVVVSAQLSLESRDAFPKDGNTHLPWRARGPFWRPPSGHFFPSLHFIYPSRSGLIRVAAPFWIPSKLCLFPGSPSGSSPSARVSPFIPQVLGHAGRTCLHLTLPAVARSPQVVRHIARSPCLGFPGGQKVAAAIQ